MVNSSEHGVNRVVHHKDYYLRGGDITVLVENHLYRIHSYFFERESLFFRQKLLGSADSSDDRGSSDTNAYTLEDVKSADFERFLWVFYNPKYSLYEAPLETWLSILQLANRWTFDNVKELCVRELEKIDIEPVEKIAIYHDNSISRLFLIPSYIAVCKRDKPLSFTEGVKLGMETVLRIADARERVRQRASESGIRTPTFEDFQDSEVEGLVREVFALGSRPTSPIPANGPASGSVNGSSGPIFKLNDPPKPNGAPAPRSNGVSAADAAKKSVDNMRSFGAAMKEQAQTATAQGSTATATVTTAPAQAPAAVPQATNPPPPPPATDKPKDKVVAETATNGANPISPSSNPMSLLGGLGEPPLAGTEGEAGCQVSDTKDVSNSSVVPSLVKNDDAPDANDDNENEKDDATSKDVDLISVLSDSEGKGGKQGAGRGNGKKNRGGQRKIVK